MNRGSAIYTPVRHAGERLGEVVTGRSGRRLVIAFPYLWLLVFFLLPFVIVLKISLAEVLLGRPPYSPLWQYLADGTVQIQLHLDNYLRLWEDPLYFVAYLKSLKIAGLSTLVCLLLGYPMAYVIARTREPLRNVLLMLIILPFWTSFLIRVYAWIGILKTNGLLNNLLLALGIIDQPLALLHTDFAVYLGIVYSYLPFMMLPLFATLSRMDLTLLEAAADLGCRPWQAFVKVTLPLSVPGIIAGCLLVFIPAVGEFVIPDLLGGPDSLMIGKVLWTEFFSNHDWPAASAVAVVMLVLLVVPLALFQWAQEVPKGERRP
jgi:putrescine transport system permease protein